MSPAFNHVKMEWVAREMGGPHAIGLLAHGAVVEAVLRQEGHGAAKAPAARAARQAAGKAEPCAESQRAVECRWITACYCASSYSAPSAETRWHLTIRSDPWVAIYLLR